MNYDKKKDLQQIQFKVYIFWNKYYCCEEDLLLTNISLKGCNSGANYQILFITWALTMTLQLLICLNAQNMQPLLCSQGDLHNFHYLSEGQ